MVIYIYELEDIGKLYNLGILGQKEDFINKYKKIIQGDIEYYRRVYTPRNKW